jgi:protein subunit release factor B
MVKDHRTGLKISQPDKVLDGDLDKLVEAKAKMGDNGIDND